ncbi:MAG TPA: hypothetical protein VHJ99_14370 [Candidatus Dormibacteraeota bacterium]|nr:hypothetical protein [Candidatus Dormibacteraeota bacterium]
MQGSRAWIAAASVGLIGFIAGAAAATAYLIGPLGYRSGNPPTARAAASPSVTPSPTATTQAIGPSPRTRASMAFDEARNVAVLFGGSGQADTWTWDGKAWQQQHPAVVPPGRSGAAMTYDPERKLVLMWGGLEGTVQGGDFWSWDGSNWAQIRAATFPPAEGVSGWANPAPILTYDSKHHQVVLIRNNGFHPAAPRPLDVWTWDGSNWSQPNITSLPPIWGTAAYDSALGSVVFFGVDANSKPQTWTFDGAAWTQTQSVLSPTVPLDDPSPVVYFKPANTAMLVDGTGGLWAWQAGDWAQQGQTSTLTSSIGYSVVFDSARGVLVRFGGDAPFGEQTWTSNGQSWARAA